ncbi:MAG: CbbQ/NirQ/NorQ/GpvN family protein [Deltaproteobacteria bacterium]|nr:MAG: CbbQ/NirQ/NorQ/GpvN family protein [Deltaproteobacteria bacterium]
MEQSAPFYRPVGREVEIFEKAHAHHLPLLLKGPTGTGKSRFVEYMAVRMGLPLITVVCHEETSAVDLLGRYLVRGNETVWMDGPLTRAVRQGAILYIDEIAEARPDTVVVLHSLTDHRRCLFLDRHDEVLEAPESFMLIASFNPGYQGAWKELKPSTRQRFVSLAFQYPEARLEAEIVANETSLPTKSCRQLVALANKVRNLHHLGLTESVSTRLLVDTARLIHAGLPARLACEVGIVEPLTDDRDVANSLKDIVALYF